MDVSRGFKHHITRLEENFKFCTPWHNKGKIIFANYMEQEKLCEEGWNNMTEEKICECNVILANIMQIEAH